MTLFGRYSATDYEDSPLDASRTSGGVDPRPADSRNAAAWH